MTGSANEHEYRIIKLITTEGDRMSDAKIDKILYWSRTIAITLIFIAFILGLIFGKLR